MIFKSAAEHLLLTSVQQVASLTAQCFRLRQHKPQLHGGSDLLRVLRTFRNTTQHGGAQQGRQVHAGLREEHRQLPGGEDRRQGEDTFGPLLFLLCRGSLMTACPVLAPPPSRSAPVFSSTWCSTCLGPSSSSWCPWSSSSSRRAGPTRRPSTTASSPSAPSASGTLWQVRLSAHTPADALHTYLLDCLLCRQ